jgi:regulator of sigma E protease
MLAWLAPILVFGLVVFVHELGHFLAAKWLGVYAPRFSIGFGPSLLKWRRGETEYVIAALPLGGYVRMASRDDEASAFLEGGSENVAPTEKTKDYDPEAMIPFGPKPIPEHRWFESKPLWARLVIMLAGVTMNALLAWVITIGIFSYYGSRELSPLPVIDSVVAGKPAALAGLKVGDSVVAVNGAPLKTWGDFRTVLSSSANRPITVDIVRKGERQQLTVTPVAEQDTDRVSGAVRTVGRIGVLPAGIRVPMSLGAATVEGTRATIDMAGMIFGALKKLFTGNVPLRTLGGPVAIAGASVEAAQSGSEEVWILVALLSINVAVFNLLPVPILDGGQILINILEAIKGRAFSRRTREYILRAGLLAIGALFVFVMFNDITRLVMRIMGKGE